MKEAVVAWNGTKIFMLLTLQKVEMSNPQSWVWQEIKHPKEPVLIPQCPCRAHCSISHGQDVVVGSLLYLKFQWLPLQHKQDAFSCDSPPQQPVWIHKSCESSHVAGKGWFQQRAALLSLRTAQNTGSYGRLFLSFQCLLLPRQENNNQGKQQLPHNCNILKTIYFLW